MKRIDDAVKLALDVAERLPDKYQLAAFTEVLRHSLEASAVDAAGSTRAAKTANRNISVPSDAPNILPEAHIIAERDDRDQQTIWAVISLNQKGIEAYNESIRDELKTTLGIRPQSRQNTNRTLRRLTPKYLVRKKQATGRGLCYVPSVRAYGVFAESSPD